MRISDWSSDVCSSDLPDVFHDVFGHVPLLADPVFADYMQAYGAGVRGSLQCGGLHRLSRLFWHTVEFGLVREKGERRIYGACIVSSRGESLFALDDPSPNRILFDLRRVMRTQYRIDHYQQNYFVLSGFDELLRVTLETDFAPLYAELDSLPDIDIAQLVEGDEIVSRGTQRSEEHTSELQSLMRISYAVFCLKKKKRS